jgi:hypothetical protein
MWVCVSVREWESSRGGMQKSRLAGLHFAPDPIVMKYMFKKFSPIFCYYLMYLLVWEFYKPLTFSHIADFFWEQKRCEILSCSHPWFLH